MRTLRLALLAFSVAACGATEPVNQVAQESRPDEAGWSIDDPRLMEWILSIHDSAQGQGAGDQGDPDKPTTCRFNNNRRCVASPHPETTRCIVHPIPVKGWFLAKYEAIHCLDVPGCPRDANGNRLGDVSGLRLCKEIVPGVPEPPVVTVCGKTGPEGCVPCGTLPPAVCGS